MNFVELQEVAEVNPRLQKRQLRPDEPVSFVPMAAVSEESKCIVSPELRPYSDVAKGYTYFEEGDVLIAKITPCFENGKIALAIGLPRPIAFGSTEFHVFRAGNQIVSSFLFHLLQSPAVRKAGAGQMQGAAGQKRVSAEFFKGLKIPLPPMEEQKRIATILDAADDLRVKRRESIAQLDALLQSTFLDMFGDPVTNPMGWDESAKLGELAEIVSGVTKGRKINGKATREVPYLAVSNVQDRHLLLEAVKTIEATNDEIVKYSLRFHDILLTEGGDPDKLGRGSLWHDEVPDCIHQNHVFRVRLLSLERLIPVFLNWLIGSAKGKSYFLRSAKQTTGIASINMRQLRAFPLLIPPLSLQRRFASIVEAAERQKARLRAHLDELDALFASLQSRAFNGEL